MSVPGILEGTVVVSQGPTAGRVVLPADRWRLVRRGLVVASAAAYLYWVHRFGLILDRISVLLAVTVVLVVAHVGRPWYRWRLLAGDLTLYVLMWLAYEETRGAADRIGLQLQVESVRNLDRVLFLGADPSVWLQRRFYDAEVVRWWDVVASITYYTHFVVPVVVIVGLWVGNRHEWVRFMRRFASVLVVACAMFVVMPTAPPWMASGGDRTVRLDALPRLARPMSRGWQHLGLDAFVQAWETGRDWVNRVAAMPSLHAAFSLLVVVFFLPWIHRWPLRALVLLYPLTMGVALVYLAEHYVVDVLVGWALVGLSFAVWGHVERRRRQRRVERSRRVLAEADVAVAT